MGGPWRGISKGEAPWGLAEKLAWAPGAAWGPPRRTPGPITNTVRREASRGAAASLPPSLPRGPPSAGELLRLSDWAPPPLFTRLLICLKKYKERTRGAPRGALPSLSKRYREATARGYPRTAKRGPNVAPSVSS